MKPRRILHEGFAADKAAEQAARVAAEAAEKAAQAQARAERLANIEKLNAEHRAARLKREQERQALHDKAKAAYYAQTGHNAAIAKAFEKNIAFWTAPVDAPAPTPKLKFSHFPTVKLDPAKDAGWDSIKTPTTHMLGLQGPKTAKQIGVTKIKYHNLKKPTLFYLVEKGRVSCVFGSSHLKVREEHPNAHVCRGIYTLRAYLRCLQIEETSINAVCDLLKDNLNNSELSITL